MNFISSGVGFVQTAKKSIIAWVLFLFFLFPAPGHSADLQSYIDTGMELSEKAKWPEAIAAFQKALELDPNHAFAHASLGVTHSMLGQHKEALLEYDQALKLGYDNAMFRYNRGVSFAQLNLLDEAEKEFLATLEKDSRIFKADYDLGIIYKLKGRIEDAHKQVDKIYPYNEMWAKKLFDAIHHPYNSITVENGGTLSGTIKLAGPKPEARSFPLVHSPNIEFCTRMSDGKGHRILHDFQVSPSGGLKDTVIAINGIPKGKPFPPSLYKLQINLCHARDYAVASRNGADFILENMDPIQHEIGTFEITKTFSDQKTNKAVIGNTSQTRSLFVKSDTETFIVQCSLHPFLLTQFLVVDNPYYTVTDSDGKFNMGDIPPGTYEVAVWHPYMPVQKGSVTINPGQEAKFDFTLNSKDVKRANYTGVTIGYRFNPVYDSFRNYYGQKRIDDPVEILQSVKEPNKLNLMQ